MPKNIKNKTYLISLINKIMKKWRKNKEMKSKSIKKNYIFNLIYNITNLLVPLLIAPYLSRILEVDGVGIKSYTLSIVSNFILFASLGMAEYGQREISKSRDDEYTRTKKLYEIGLLRFFTTFIILIIYILTLVLPIVNTNYNIIYAILIINIIANMLDFSWFLQGIEEFKAISYIQIISKIFLVFMTFTLVKTKMDLNISILINSLTLLINAVLSTFVVKRYCIKIKIKELKFIKHLKECFVYFVPAIAVQIYTVLDKTMIGIMTNSTYENGYYEQADKIIKILITIVTTTNAIMKSRITYLYEKEKKSEIKTLIVKSTSLCMLIAIPMMFGIVATARIFVPIFFGNGYEKTSTILIILAPLSIIIGISGLIGSHYYTPLGRKRESNKCLIIGSIINFIINLILIKPFGAIGAAIGTIIAELTITILYIKKCDKDLFNYKLFIKISYKYLISGIIMMISLLFIRHYMGNGIKDLIILVITGGLIYILMLLILKDKYMYENIKEFTEKLKNGKD